MHETQGWTIGEWRAAYRNGDTPAGLLTTLLHELLHELPHELRQDGPVWISLLDEDGLNEALTGLAVTLAKAGGDAGALPLYGVPFAVKDNIDAIGFDTTAGCPDYAYRPDRDATAVARLKAAGAVVIGKTNLDQFATGLVGTRSPYGAVPNSFDPAVISGGSSSGSAVAVAHGLVPFALGTDTAGSGRIPAGLNNVIGLKPTRGACSIEGVVPACRSLDCVSVFSLTVADAALVYQQMQGYAAADPFSRTAPPAFSPTEPAIRRPGPIRRLGIPDQHTPAGDAQAQTCWRQVTDRYRQLGIELVATDFSLLNELAALLYEGPWVAERHVTLEGFIEHNGDAMHPVVREIINRATAFSATDSFKSQYRREELIRGIDQQLADIDGLLVPTVPYAPTIAEVEADPVTLNSRLGRFSNFVNLADFCALSVPAGQRADGIPFGLTLISGAWRDHNLQAVAAHWLNSTDFTLGATGRPRPAEPAIDGRGYGDRRSDVTSSLPSDGPGEH